MILREPMVWLYAVIYLIALVIAILKRKTFPLGETLGSTLIVGIGFTGLVYLVTLRLKSTPLLPIVQTGEVAFTLAYVVIVALLLVRGAPVPTAWKEHFLKNKLVMLAFKLVVFVLVPLAVLRLVWTADWAGLGFTAGDVPGQLIAAAILILLFGGFNLLAGGAAKPIRERQFPLKQVLLGVGLAFLWNVVEVGLVEEFFFRGFLQTRLVGLFGAPASGICAASLLFGLAHVPGIYLRRGDRHGPLGEHPTLLNSILYGILALSPTGWFTGLLFWRTQSLLAPILVHAAVDAVAHAAEFIEGLKLGKRDQGHPSSDTLSGT